VLGREWVWVLILGFIIIIQTATINTAAGVGSWQSVGPSPIDSSTLGKDSQNIGLTSGRITAIAFDPRPIQAGTIYVGSAQGGVWKSADGGKTWNPLTDDQSSLAVGSIAVNSTGAVYIGTGEGNLN